ncbi:MAG: TetR family transcriptional regulator [Krumholzibacteria bacterium]|nr:TetR family transcriptional regulator [Candidatus Krumholzibacteria bacterium]
MRKPVFSKDDVVMAGLAVARRDGLEQLSARRVAEQLGASTAPVYSNFATMAALAEAVKRAAVRELVALTRQEHTDHRFLNMGVGVLKFVWAWPQLYADLFLAPPQGYDPGLDLLEELTATMAALPELEPLDLSERLVVLRKLAIFTHGLATEICQGCAPSCTLQTLELLLGEVGRAVVADARAGHPRSDADTALLAGLCSRLPEPDPHPEEDGR